MALRIVRKSVGLRPRTFGGGRSAEISSNSASDISVEYRSRMTSYFARSASFQGIANLPKLLQTRENQTPRGRSTNFRSGSQINKSSTGDVLWGVRRVVTVDDHIRVERLVHQLLASWRNQGAGQRREIFHLSADDAFARA